MVGQAAAAFGVAGLASVVVVAIAHAVAVGKCLITGH
jgi:hypothetical protein